MENKKKIILGIVVVFALFGGLLWLSRPASPDARQSASTSASRGRLIAEHASFDFGTVSMAQGNVTHRFTIQNTGTDPVVIRRMLTSCMCTTATLIHGDNRFGPFGMPGHGFIPRINETIAPNEEASVEVVFDPAAHGPAGVGRIDRSISLEQEGQRQPFELSIRAVVTP